MAQMRKNAAGRYSPLLIVCGVCINERSPSVLFLRTKNKPAQVAQDKCTPMTHEKILMRHNRHPWFQACALFLRSMDHRYIICLWRKIINGALELSSLQTRTGLVEYWRMACS